MGTFGDSGSAPGPAGGDPLSLRKSCWREEEPNRARAGSRAEPGQTGTGQGSWLTA